MSTQPILSAPALTGLTKELYDVLKWHHDQNIRNDIEYRLTAVYRATQAVINKAEGRE